jgi:O-antigen ligase
MSVLFVRFYPEIGRAYTGFSQNDLMYVGVATHKNTLGALLLVSCIFLVWDLADRRRAETQTTRRSIMGWVDSLAVLAMAVWLLRIADSATAMLCTVGGVGLFAATRFGVFRRRLRHVEVYAVLGICSWYVLDSAFHISELVVSSVGRDMTLTTRTDAWELFFQLDINPIVGAGFKSFWAGDRMAQIWREFPGIVQAHNGYIETYLEGGLLGLMVLFALLMAGFRKIKRGLLSGEEFAGVRLTFWVITLFYNFSEAAFTQLSLLWIVTLLVLVEAPFLADAAQDRSAAVPALATVGGRSRWRRAEQYPAAGDARRPNASAPDAGMSPVDRRASMAAIPGRRR